MEKCILCENELGEDGVCKFCGLDNRNSRTDRASRTHDFVWPDMRIKYPASRSVPIKFFARSNRMKILNDLERKSMRVAGSPRI